MIKHSSLFLALALLLSGRALTAAELQTLETSSFAQDFNHARDTRAKKNCIKYHFPLVVQGGSCRNRFTKTHLAQVAELVDAPD